MIGVQANKLSFSQIIEKYENLGFIYSSKKDTLKPQIKEIEKNWGNLLNGNEIFQLLTIEHQTLFATGCVWRNTMNGWFVQHGTSNKLIGFLLILLEEQKFLIKDGKIKSAQVWFQDKNSTVNKICNEALLGINKDLFLTEQLHYFLWKPDYFQSSKSYTVKEFSSEFREVFNHFIIKNKGNVYLYGEELHEEDMELKSLNNIFKKHKLNRSRKVFLIFDNNNILYSVVIFYYASIGINFSLLENRCEIIVDKGNNKRSSSFYSTLANLIFNYANKNISMTPIITDYFTSKLFNLKENNKARTYTRHIWLSPCFEEWYKNFSKLFNKIINKYNLL